jgi:hypothetical protein
VALIAQHRVPDSGGKGGLSHPTAQARRRRAPPGCLAQHASGVGSGRPIPQRRDDGFWGRASAEGRVSRPGSADRGPRAPIVAWCHEKKSSVWTSLR